jgi:L-ornithine N5-monooxygenase
MPVSAGDSGLIHDVIGVGFGPSNLALAIAVAEEESPLGDGTSALFLERQPEFGWHRGMLIDDATMQVSFLKDLVTLRNPASRFSFLSYLHSRDRLVDFINHKNLFPLRVEFHDYLEWAAEQVAHLVHYRHEVVSVRPVTLRNSIEGFEVTARGPEGELARHRARNVVFGVGMQPRLPEGVAIGPRIWHNRDLLRSVEDLGAAQPSRFVVVGAGQSAAEVTAFLHRRFPAAEVCGVFSRYGYSPADDSSFANRIFDPDAVDHFYSAPEHVKRMMLDYHGNTNYSVVDLELIQDLYRRVYQEKVLGTERLRLFSASRLSSVTETPDGVQVTVESLTTTETTVLDTDIVVYATGYLPADPRPLLGDLTDHCRHDDQGRLCVERAYRVVVDTGVRGGIYLQGGTEHTHGLSSSLLSNAAVRAADILRSIAEHRRRTLPDRCSVAAGTGHDSSLTPAI